MCWVPKMITESTSKIEWLWHRYFSYDTKKKETIFLSAFDGWWNLDISPSRKNQSKKNHSNHFMGQKGITFCQMFTPITYYQCSCLFWETEKAVSSYSKQTTRNTDTGSLPTAQQMCIRDRCTLVCVCLCTHFCYPIA